MPQSERTTNAVDYTRLELSVAPASGGKASGGKASGGKASGIADAQGLDNRELVSAASWDTETVSARRRARTGWQRLPEKRSLLVNGELIRTYRERRGWTQRELAELAGYSERLVRKAESSGALRPDTIEVLAETLSRPRDPVFPEDLISDPRRLAQQVVHAYQGESLHLVDQHTDWLAPNVMCWCAGDPQEIPFAGEYEAAEGFVELWRSLFAALRRPNDGFFKPRLVAEGNEVVAMGTEQWQLPGSAATRHTWWTMRMAFRRGRLMQLELYFDTKQVAELLACEFVEKI